jgi:hypothetical protein
MIKKIIVTLWVFFPLITFKGSVKPSSSPIKKNISSPKSKIKIKKINISKSNLEYDKNLKQLRKDYSRFMVGITAIFDYKGFLKFTQKPITNLQTITNGLYKLSSTSMAQPSENIKIIGPWTFQQTTSEENQAISDLLNNPNGGAYPLLNGFFVGLGHFFIHGGCGYRYPITLNTFWENNIFLFNGLVVNSTIAHGFHWQGIHWESLWGLNLIGPHRDYDKEHLETYEEKPLGQWEKINLYPLDKIKPNQVIIGFNMGIRCLFNIFPDMFFIRHRLLALDLILFINQNRWLLNFRIHAVGKYQPPMKNLSMAH